MSETPKNDWNAIAPRLAALFSPLDRRPVYEWARDHVELGNNYTITGKFDVANSPWLREPFDALKSDHVRVVHLRSPPRGGKTLLADVWIPWTIANSPGPVMWNMQTDAMAKDHAKMRVIPTMEQCEPVKALMPEDRHSKNVQEIHFRNGVSMFVQGPAESGLQSKGVRYLINDEIWCWPPGRIYQAYYRIKDFEKMGMSKVLNITQGGLQDDDEDCEFFKGTVVEWEVRCPQCQGCFVPALEFNKRDSEDRAVGFQFEEAKLPLGEWDVPTCAKTIHHICPDCFHHSEDSATVRSCWNQHGRYRCQTGEDHSKATRLSFHYEASIIRPWRGILTEYLYAVNASRKGVVDHLCAWHQKERAMAWSDLMLFASNPPKTFEFQSEWPDEAGRVMTVDKQTLGLYWVMVRQWAQSGESRRLFYGRCHGEVELVAKQEEFKVEARFVFVDAGNEAYGDDGVYAMCIRHQWSALLGDTRQFFLHKGRDSHGRPMSIPRAYSRKFAGDPHSGTVRAKQIYAEVYRWSNPTIRNRLQQLIDRGLWMEPNADPTDENEIEYRRQMSAVQQRQDRDKRTGRMIVTWYERSRNNHAHDCACMQLVAATAARWLPENDEVIYDPRKSETPSVEQEPVERS